mmetsp:Transcript_23351/g.33506  ORF Transcript_23351/g.33506 Transcript_23351/m.33506 type:complete len:115 (+) Transcript_23351:2501-2845(+)
MGLAGARILGSKIQKRIGSIKQFEFVDASDPMASASALTLAISGWVTNPDEFTQIWQGLSATVREEVCFAGPRLPSFVSPVEQRSPFSAAGEVSRLGAGHSRRARNDGIQFPLQ